MAFVLPALISCAVTFAAEPDPRPEKQPEIEAAIERGNTIREQDEIAPGALQSVALIMKRNGVRCGHVYMTLMGARGEAGATYRLTMQLKAAAVQDERAVMVQHDGSFLLGADLSLMNGDMTQDATWQERGGGGGLIAHRVIKLTGERDAMLWEISEQGPDDTAPKKKGEQKVPLKNFKPLPSEVLPMLAALAGKKNQFTPGDGKPLCVPSISLSELPLINIRPAWVAFVPPPSESIVKIAKEDTASIVRIRYLKGGMVDGGLNVQPATADDWLARADYGLDARQKIVALPKPSEAKVTLEAVEASKLNPQEPYEFDAILRSYQAPAEPPKDDAKK